MAKFKWLGALSLAGAVLGLSVAACSTDGDSESGCTTDTDCKGDRVCNDGQCVDGTGGTGGTDGTGATSGMGATSSLGEGGGSSQGGKAGSSPGPTEPMDGDRCVLSSSDCDPDCVNSCGSPECVDLCCSDSASFGVLCDGMCREPKCTSADSTENWPAALRDRPWVCYEREEDGETFCACTNSLTAAQVEGVGDTLVESCGGEYCGFDLDGQDLLCECRSDPAMVPGWECTMATEPEACCGGNYCSLPRDDCSTPPVLRCTNPCEELTVD